MTQFLTVCSLSIFINTLLKFYILMSNRSSPLSLACPGMVAVCLVFLDHLCNAVTHPRPLKIHYVIVLKRRRVRHHKKLTKFLTKKLTNLCQFGTSTWGQIRCGWYVNMVPQDSSTWRKYSLPTVCMLVCGYGWLVQRVKSLDEWLKVTF